MGNQCVRKCLVAFNLSLGFHDLYRLLLEACEDPLQPVHIEQQLVSQKPVLLKGFIEKKMFGILVCDVSVEVDSSKMLS